MARARRVVAVVVLGLAAIAAGGWFAVSWLMEQPLYRPGSLAQQMAGLPLPRPSVDPTRWAMGDGVELHHFSVGEGPRVLVVHGGPGLPFESAPPGMAGLASGAPATLTFYDQRGCGRSTRPISTVPAASFYENLKRVEGTLGVGAQLADLERIRRTLKEEQLVLLGHSWGGFLAALYAAEFPERVRALILVAPADVLVFPPPTGGLYPLVRERLPEGQRGEFDEWLRTSLDFPALMAKSDLEMSALNRAFARFYSAASPSPAGGSGGDEFGAAVGGWMVQAQYLSLGRRHDYRSALRRVRAPVLILHGSLDLQPESVARQYQAAFPEAQLQTIAGAGHFPFLDQPDAFTTSVMAFLARVRGPGG